MTPGCSPAPTAARSTGPTGDGSGASPLAVAGLDATLPDGLRFHDLRHTGNTLAAATGASTRELMARMGHASTRAAMIYQHATDDRDQAIARALGDVIGRQAPAQVIPIGRGAVDATR